MREILFRGKYFGEWVEGSLLVFPNTKRKKIVRWNNADLEFDQFDVNAKTIGQYTGITDKNGKKIFEGDIVSFKRVNALGLTTSRVGDVRYYDKLPIYYIMATTGDAWDWVVCEDIEVIGNIHDSPELLKGGASDA